MSGNKLYSEMNSQDVMDRMYALGYVLGVHDSLEGEVVCASSQATAGQMRDVVKKYLEDNPAQRDMSAFILVMVSLGQAFPCKQPKGKKS